VLVLSQYVDTHHVMELIASGGGVGYLLKDHVGDMPSSAMRFGGLPREVR